MAEPSKKVVDEEMETDTVDIEGPEKLLKAAHNPLEVERSKEMQSVEEVERSEFMEKLLKLDHRNIQFTMENIRKSPWNPTGKVEHQDIVDGWCQHSPPLQGIDLGDVKHFKHSDLGPYVTSRRLLSRTARFGRLYVGKVKQQQQPDGDGNGNGNGNGKGSLVVIKTWDVTFPPTWGSDYSLQPTRLYNELQLLTKEPMKSHPHVPNLLGYSIDQMLAVVYDFKVKYALSYLLTVVGIGWYHRLYFAVNIGRILQSFHDLGIAIGCIETQMILFDKEFKIYFCDFGLTDHVEKMMDGGLPNNKTIAGYGLFSPEVRNSTEKWTMATDIYAYGVLLLQLFQVEGVGYFDPLDKKILSEDSLVKDSFVDDENTRSEISQLVRSCLKDRPSDRPKAGDVALALQKFLTIEEDKLEMEGTDFTSAEGKP